MEIPTTVDTTKGTKEMMKNSERIDIHRLFYVDHNDSSNNDEYKIAGDSQNMSKVILALHQLNPDKEQLFGMFG